MPLAPATIASLLVLALGATEGTAYWWMHPAPAGSDQPVLCYRPSARGDVVSGPLSVVRDRGDAMDAAHEPDSQPTTDNRQPTTGHGGRGDVVSGPLSVVRDRGDAMDAAHELNSQRTTDNRQRTTGHGAREDVVSGPLSVVRDRGDAMDAAHELNSQRTTDNRQPTTGHGAREDVVSGPLSVVRDRGDAMDAAREPDSQPTTDNRQRTTLPQTTDNSSADNRQPTTDNSPNSPTFTLLPEVVANSQRSLHCSSGTAARVDRADGATIHIAFFKWDVADSTSVIEAFKHLPEACMGSIGMTLTSHQPPRTYQVGGETLTFDHTVFRDPRGAIIHAFKSTWVSGVNSLLGSGRRGGLDDQRQLRWKAVCNRFRPAHSCVVQGAVRSIANPDLAWQAFESAMLVDLAFENR